MTYAGSTLPISHGGNSSAADRATLEEGPKGPGRALGKLAQLEMEELGKKRKGTGLGTWSLPLFWFVDGSVSFYKRDMPWFPAPRSRNRTLPTCPGSHPVPSSDLPANVRV